MSEPRVLRTLRQKRLREVGEAGQARLFAASAHVPYAGLRGDFAVRYLVGAGLARIAAPVEVHAAARAIDEHVELSAIEASTAPDDAPAGIEDPAAREAFAGALAALRIVRDRLAGR